jgi:hypothetical protein
MGCKNSLIAPSVNYKYEQFANYYGDYAFSNFRLHDTFNFLHACMHGDMSIVVQMYKKNKNIIHAKCYKVNETNYKYDWKGRNGFMVACLWGKPEVAIYLYGCDSRVVNCIDENARNIFSYKINEEYVVINELLASIKKTMNKYKLINCAICSNKITSIGVLYGIDNVTCPLCLDICDTPVVTNCGHIYCKKCIVLE